MSALDRAASIEDLRLLAKRRLPRFAFDFVDGGAESERGLRRNVEAFAEIAMTPRYLVDVSEVRTETELFGRSWGAPFGMAPVGFLNIAWPGADLMIARLAAAERFPHVISTASSTAIERIVEASEGHAWFQLYVSRLDTISAGLLDRAEASGCDVLMVTVDVSQPGKRDRDTRNGLEVPFRYTPRILADLALHPRWSLGTLRAGAPGYANLDTSQLWGGGSVSVVEMQRGMISNTFVWEDLKRLRDRWRGKLLLKGVLHAGDAALALEVGCDGLVVSNHGGRQADYAPAAIEALPSVAEAVAGRVPILLDSGVRRGADIIRAKALGADFALLGRAFAYGAAAGAEPGCRRAFDIVKTELNCALGQLGRPDFAGIGPEILAAPPTAAPRPSGARETPLRALSTEA